MSGTETPDHANGVPAEKPNQPKLCGVCHEQDAKYKCIKCELPFCSANCSKLHKAEHPETDSPAPNAPEPKAETTNGSHQTNGAPGTVSGAKNQNPFAILEVSKELEQLFLRYPRLKSQLRDIHNSTLSPSEGGTGVSNHVQQQQQYQDQHNHRGGRGRGRGGRGARPVQAVRGPWTPDQGTQDGIDALTRAKEEYGKLGEGVREYADLVMKLVSAGETDVAKLVQDEVTEDNARLIAQLLSGEV